MWVCISATILRYLYTRTTVFLNAPTPTWTVDLWGSHFSITLYGWPPQRQSIALHFNHCSFFGVGCYRYCHTDRFCELHISRDLRPLSTVRVFRKQDILLFFVLLFWRLWSSWPDNLYSFLRVNFFHLLGSRSIWKVSLGENTYFPDTGCVCS